jgi:hypothetical protein
MGSPFMNLICHLIDLFLLLSVPFVPNVPSVGTKQSFVKSINSKKDQVPESGTKGPLGTTKTELEDYFPVGQFPVCFSCHLPVSQLSELTNIYGYPIHKECKALIDAQKKNEN